MTDDSDDSDDSGAAAHVAEADTGILRLAKDDEIWFWQSVQQPPAPTQAQLRLGELVRSVM